MDFPQWGQAPGTGNQPQISQTGGNPPVPPQNPDTGNYRMPDPNLTFAPDYPFEEPEEAPELRSDRSQSLYSRSEPFWERVYDLPKEGEEYPRDANYWNHPEELADEHLMVVEPKHKGEKWKNYLGAGVVKKLIIVLGVLLAVCVVLYSTIFQVRDIRVEGNTEFPASEVIRLSGLKMGMNTMSIDEEAVTRRIETNRYLRCTLVDVRWNSVTLHVTERVPIVYINHNGMQITLDNRGWALEESLDTSVRYADLIFVTGLNIRHCVLGQAIRLEGNSQMETYTRILVELKAMKGLSLIKELDLSRMDRIYLATHDGFYVHMGDEERIHEKLRSMMITREKVIEMGHKGGTIDVTDPEKPTFTPENLM